MSTAKTRVSGHSVPAVSVSSTVPGSAMNQVRERSFEGNLHIQYGLRPVNEAIHGFRKCATGLMKFICLFKHLVTLSSNGASVSFTKVLRESLQRFSI